MLDLSRCKFVFIPIVCTNFELVTFTTLANGKWKLTYINSMFFRKMACVKCDFFETLFLFVSYVGRKWSIPLLPYSSQTFFSLHNCVHHVIPFFPLYRFKHKAEVESKNDQFCYVVEVLFIRNRSTRKMQNAIFLKY